MEQCCNVKQNLCYSFCPQRKKPATVTALLSGTLWFVSQCLAFFLVCPSLGLESKHNKLEMTDYAIIRRQWWPLRQWHQQRHWVQIGAQQQKPRRWAAAVPLCNGRPHCIGMSRSPVDDQIRLLQAIASNCGSKQYIINLDIERHWLTVRYCGEGDDNDIANGWNYMGLLPR